MQEGYRQPAEGFIFYTKTDAEAAEREREKINYLESRLDYSNPQNVLAIYNRALDSRTFKTPVGTEYLRKLQKFLKDMDVQGIRDIPLYQSYTYAVSAEKKYEPVRQVVKPRRKIGIREKYHISLLVNIVLIILVAAMFWITLTGSNPNILNYENALIDKYSSWEQELLERENAVREREKALNFEK